MRHAKVFTLLFVALLTVGAIGAAAAMAEEAPYFGVESKRLAAGESKEITTSKLSTSLELTGATNTLVCSKVATAKGAKIIGSNAGDPGTDEEVEELSGCSVTGNGSPCSVKEPIITHTLISTLALESKKKAVVDILEPKAGEILATMEFTGAGCNVTSTLLEGSAAAEVLSGAGVLVELGKTPTLEASGRRFFPSVRIAATWLIKAGVGIVKHVSLKWFGVTATLDVNIQVQLVAAGKWCVLS